MILLRKLLFPFAILYGLITQIRNYLYNNGILKSSAFDIPIIAVGNLSVGGTGKSPQIEYLVRLLSVNYRVATLSRGYKRKSSGFILADEKATAETLGDEPYQFHLKFPEISVAVDADRRNGIRKLLSGFKPQVILLDDAYQHRKVNAGFYILLTPYGDLFTDDFMLPTGNLRESRNGAGRANLVVVTKCPDNIGESEAQEIIKAIRKYTAADVYFSSIQYDDCVFSETGHRKVAEIRTEPKLLLAGIAKPKPFFGYLQSEGDVVMEFPDHHHFSDQDIASIKQKAGNRLIITTEKDFVRLSASLRSEQLFYLPIKSAFVAGQNQFDKTILDYVGKSTGNS